MRRAHRGWRVVIPCEGGRVLEYLYAKRRQAEYYASVFRMAPTWYPAPHRVRASSMEQTVKIRRLVQPSPDERAALADELCEALDEVFAEACA